MKFKNRIILPPMAREKSIDGKPNEELISYYETMAKAGFGLIILEHAYVSKNGKASPYQMGIDEDYDKVGLAKIAETIHKYDCPCVMQINHAGIKAKTDQNVYGPSSIDNAIALDKDQIKEIVKNFTDAAVRVKNLGFDAVEIHSAHGYLLNQFYSPLTNKRTDEYGGSLENRLRIHKEIIESIREKLADYKIFLRLGAADYIEAGNTEEIGVEAAKLLEGYGVDVIDISGGINGYLNHPDVQYGYFSSVSKKIKEVVDIPVITTGGITNLKECRDLLDNNICDFVGVGRHSLKNPNWLKEELKKE
jgi:NADPH2 dehydrogenase